MKHSQSLLKDLLRNSSRSTKILFFSAIVSFVFGFWGWYTVREELLLNWGDIVYRSIAALTLSVPYQTGADWNHEWRIEIARWFGIVALITGAGKASFALFEDHWRARQARNRKGHWLVVGDDLFATQLCQAAINDNHTVHWLAAGAGHTASKQLVIDESHWSLREARSMGLGRAAGVILATSDDAATGAIAREIRSAYPDEQQLTILASIRSPWLAMRIDEIEGASSVTVFSEAQIAVRLLQRRQPPFMIAESFGQRRIHVVIADFSDWGEAVLIETLLSSLTTRLGKPLFTIIDPRADSIEQDLANRYPELSQSADLVFVRGSFTSYEKIIGADDLAAVADRAPVSLFFSCHSDDEVSLVTAIALQSLSRKQERWVAPIFTRLSNKQGLAMVSSGVRNLKPGDLVGFGSLKELASEISLFSNRADQLAKEFHLAYVDAASDGKSAKIPWAELTEDMRDANRRLVVHIPAKLHCLSFDLENWLKHVDRHPGKIRLPTIPGVSSNTPLVEELAILEHERWMADRRINGWSYGPVRDNMRRIHPDLIPFSKLSEESRTYDRMIVRSFLKMIEGDDSE